MKLNSSTPYCELLMQVMYSIASVADPEIHISILIKPPLFKASIWGFQAAIVEVIQTLTWMSAVIRISATNRVKYLVVTLGTHYSGGFYMQFKTEPLPKREKSCWYPLFVNPVTARGFLTIPPKHHEIGLEILIDMMAALGGARYAVEFEGGLLLKGLNSMFVPTRSYSGFI
jgi:hypothetical protein